MATTSQFPHLHQRSGKTPNAETTWSLFESSIHCFGGQRTLGPVSRLLWPDTCGAQKALQKRSYKRYRSLLLSAFKNQIANWPSLFRRRYCHCCRDTNDPHLLANNRQFTPTRGPPYKKPVARKRKRSPCHNPLCQNKTN